MKSASWFAVAIGLACLAAEPPDNAIQGGCFAIAILVLERFSVDLGDGARFCPAAAFSLGAALDPQVGSGLPAVLLLLESAYRKQSLPDRLGLVLALGCAALLRLLPLPVWGAWLVVPPVYWFATLGGPARRIAPLQSADRLRWQGARLQTRPLEGVVAAAGPALAAVSSAQPLLLCLLIPAFASLRQAGESLVFRAQNVAADAVLGQLNQARSSEARVTRQWQETLLQKEVLQGFAQFLAGSPGLADVAQGMVETVVRLFPGADVAVFWNGPDGLNPCYYQCQAGHQGRLQGSRLTGRRELLVEKALASGRPHQGGGDFDGFFPDNAHALAIPLERAGVLYVGRPRGHWTQADQACLNWLGKQALLGIQVACREQERQRQQQGQALAMVGLRQELASYRFLLQCAQVLGSTLLHEELLQQFGGILEEAVPHQRRALLVKVGSQRRKSVHPPGAEDSLLEGWLEEVAHSPNILHRPGEGQTILGSPLGGGGAVLLARVGPQPFQIQEVELLELLCTQAALAFSRADLFRQVVDSRRELEQSQAQLIQSSKLNAIGQLAAGVAHELNTPLGAISVSLELACQRLPDRPEAALKGLEKARQATLRCQSIIERLLVYARPSDHEQHPLELGQLCRQALSLVAYDIKAGESQIQSELEDRVAVLGNAQELQQILLHLLVNAMQSVTAEQASNLVIRARVKREGEWALCEIEDNGCGIEPANLERVFDPFFTTRPIGQGAGLGLSVSQQIAQQHRGCLEVESRLGSGSLFRLRLPALPTTGTAEMKEKQ